LGEQPKEKDLGFVLKGDTFGKSTVGHGLDCVEIPRIVWILEVGFVLYTGLKVQTSSCAHIEKKQALYIIMSVLRFDLPLYLGSDPRRAYYSKQMLLHVVCSSTMYSYELSALLVRIQAT
jgi:hypothetical protein